MATMLSQWTSTPQALSFCTNMLVRYLIWADNQTPVGQFHIRVPRRFHICEGIWRVPEAEITFTNCSHEIKLERNHEEYGPYGLKNINPIIKIRVVPG